MSLTPSKKLNAMPRYSDKFKDVLKRISEQQKTEKAIIPRFFFYRIKSIGIGAHSVVYLVQDDSTKAVYAQKCITRQHALENQENLVNQIKIHLQLKHRNLIELYHVYFDECSLYLIMENGFQSLFGYLQRKKSLEQGEVRTIISEILNGVNYLHQKEVVHADLKLQNIVMKSGQIKICDFGYAHRFGVKIENQPVGTLEYLSPELINEEYVKFELAQPKNCWKRDIWAIGMICYELITGEHLMAGMPETQKWLSLLKFESVDLGKVEASDDIKQFLRMTLCQEANRQTTFELLKLKLFSQEPISQQELL